MTTLLRWMPGRDFINFHDEVSRVLDGAVAAPRPSTFSPAVDIEETQDEFVLRADVPGVAQKDVKVSLNGDTLTIRGERATQLQDRRMHRVERVSGTFERNFTLTVPVSADRISALYRDGVLEVHVPKAEEARVREIEIKVAS